jgi:4-amino-4-deoxy-L-arabinose transferase-like glycosyltransferase
MNRYDIAVPVFGFAALWVVLREASGSRSMSYLLSGCLAGLSGLSHLYGAFWLPTLIAFLALGGGLTRSTFRAAGLLIAGFALVWLPWAIWVGLNWSDYVAQMRTVGSRLDVLSPAFYLVNVMSGDGPISIGGPHRHFAGCRSVGQGHGRWRSRRRSPRGCWPGEDRHERLASWRC